MGLQLVFSVEGRKEVLRDLDTRGRKAKNLQAPLKESADYMMKVIDQNFGSHGGVFAAGYTLSKQKYPTCVRISSITNHASHANICHAA